MPPQPQFVRRLLILAPISGLACASSGTRIEDNPGPATGGDPGEGVLQVPSDSDLRDFLRDFRPGSPHEARPHGVPTDYDWSSAAQMPKLDPPNGETVANFWGQIYVDETGVIPSDVRVAVKGSRFLALYEGSDDWVVVQEADELDGGAWAEDFHSRCDDSAYDAREEPDGTVSFVTTTDCNAHYWPRLGQADVEESKLQAALVVAFVRLVRNTASDVEPSDSSSYLISVGADWRSPGGACPTPVESMVPVCSPIGGGKFIVVGPSFRTVVFSTLDEAELQTLPLPPLSAFAQPDGNYFR